MSERLLGISPKAFIMQQNPISRTQKKLLEKGSSVDIIYVVVCICYEFGCMFDEVVELE